jgi:hypothetical protein
LRLHLRASRSGRLRSLHIPSPQVQQGSLYLHGQSGPHKSHGNQRCARRTAVLGILLCTRNLTSAETSQAPLPAISLHCHLQVAVSIGRSISTLRAQMTNQDQGPFLVDCLIECLVSGEYPVHWDIPINTRSCPKK